MGFVTMPMAALSVVLMPLHLDAVPLHIMGWGIAAMLAVGRFVSCLPGAVSIVAATPVAALVLVSLGGLWIVIWRNGLRWLGLAPALAGILLVVIARPPDILVARDGQTIAFRGNDGRLYFMRRAADEYSASEWLKRDGDSRTADRAIASARDGVRCDAFGCVAQSAGGLRIAAVLRRDALRDDCEEADVVVSLVPARATCPNPKLVIDRFDVAKNGAYAVWLGKHVVVESTEQLRGARPWSAVPWQRRTQRFSSGG
jgi:competence protein ComEC